MIKQSIRNLYRHEFEDEVRDYGCKSVEDVVDLLFGTEENYEFTQLVVKRASFKKPRQTAGQRLNTLWVYPVFIISMPFRYVLFGSATVSEDSRLGRVLIFLIGELK